MKGQRISLVDNKESTYAEGLAKEREFEFDRCYWNSPPSDAEEMESRPMTEPMEHTMQRYIFNDIGRRLVESTVEGYNGALIAYGQTGV